MNAPVSIARYDAIADVYAAEFVSADDPVSTALLDLAGPVAGLRVLDIACGHGRVSRELARRGAQVTGLDISARLLGLAAQAEQQHPLGITYLLADIAAWPGRRRISTSPPAASVCPTSTTWTAARRASPARCGRAAGSPSASCTRASAAASTCPVPGRPG